MTKVYYRKIEVCPNCPFHYVNNLEGFSRKCILEAKTLDDKEIPDWCPLADYEEKIEADETGNVWIKIKKSNG